MELVIAVIAIALLLYPLIVLYAVLAVARSARLERMGYLETLAKLAAHSAVVTSPKPVEAAAASQMLEEPPAAPLQPAVAEPLPTVATLDDGTELELLTPSAQLFWEQLKSPKESSNADAADEPKTR